MYLWSPNLSQISLKNSFGKVVFQIFVEIEMTRNENRFFGRHFETVQYFFIFFAGIWLYLVYVFMVYKWLQNSGGNMVFLGGVHGTPPPYALTEVWGTLCS